MRNLLLILLLSGFIVSCTKDANSPYTYSSESTIYSQTDNTLFKDILLIIKPYTLVNNQKMYLVAEKIENISILVNSNSWGNFQSLSVDTSKIAKTVSGNYTLSSNPVKYAVIAPQQSDKDTLTTAGEYSDLINNFLTLKPGDYICQLEYFDIKLNNSITRRIYPMLTMPFEVRENTRSSFIGEFEIEVNY